MRMLLVIFGSLIICPSANASCNLSWLDAFYGTRVCAGNNDTQCIEACEAKFAAALDLGGMVAGICTAEGTAKTDERQRECKCSVCSEEELSSDVATNNEIRGKRGYEDLSAPSLPMLRPPLDCFRLDHRKLPPGNVYYRPCRAQSPYEHAQCRARCDLVFGDLALSGACIGPHDPYPSDAIVRPVGFFEANEDSYVVQDGTGSQDSTQDSGTGRSGCDSGQSGCQEGYQGVNHAGSQQRSQSGAYGSYYGNYYKLDCVCRLCYEPPDDVTTPTPNPTGMPPRPQ